jgi:DNA invertase Pin-like site-specific DNA recombinase
MSRRADPRGACGPIVLRADGFSRYSIVMNPIFKYFLYVRKSTDDTSRQIRSIDDQIAELRELAAREHLEIIEIFIEKQTAKKPGRPIFNAMMARIESGEAQGILAWHPDRLSRNSVDAGRIIWDIDTGVIKDLRFPTYWFEPTAQGKFTLSIMLSQSKYYVDNLSENIRRGQRQKIKNGIWPGWAPLGYQNDKATRTIVPDPHRAPLIRKAFELYATGEYTIDRITETVNALGLIARNGEPLSRAQYHRILQNPIYHGLIEYKRELHEGAHEPIISRALFDAVSDVMKRRSKPKNPKFKPYLYRGFCRCGECGRLVTTETQKGFNYLRCSKWKVACSQPYLREERMAEQIAAVLARISLPDEIADWLIAEFDQERHSDHERATAQLEKIRNTIAAIDEKIDRLMTLYLDQAITPEEYRSAKNKLISEKEVLTSSLTAFEHNRSIPFEPAIRFIKATKQARILATEGNPDEQRDFLRKAASNFSLRDRTLDYELRKPFQLVANQRFPDANKNAAHDECAALPTEIDLLAKMRCWLDEVRTFFMNNPVWE